MCFLSNFYHKYLSYHSLHVLTLFAPKRSVSFLLFLTFGGIACSNPDQEISGIYETTISTTSDFALDTLTSSDSVSSDSGLSNPGLSNPELSNPGSSNQGRTLLLELYEDHRAEFSTNFLDNEPAIVQKGTWALLDSNRIRTYFIEKDGKFFLDTLTFHREGSRLVLRGNRNSVTDEINLIRID